ncbi:MAG TPA: M1 family aminopeptidase [Cyclobacteriaceae bacterium]|nr:M1 family aminopeptidase [Cyclobacteriaceae bacterium]
MAGEVFIDEPLNGGYFLNAPYIVTSVCLITFFFLGLLILAPLAGNAAARDIETRMHPLLYTSPVPKHTYLAGRFLAAYALGSLILVAIPAGVFGAALFPIDDAAIAGPHNLAAYVSTYFLMLLPNAFVVMAFMFGVAVLNRKGILTYLVAVIIGIATIASWQFLGVQESNWTLANLADPLGVTIMMELKKIWSANQKNTLLPAIENSAILNRLLWLALSAGMLLITYAAFRTSTISIKNKKAEGSAIKNGERLQVASPVIPKTLKSFDSSTRLLQISTVTRESFKLIATGWGWMALACMFLFVLLSGSMWFSDYYDIPELPVTGNLLGTLENVKDHGIWFIIPLLIIYYAGELVWRERDARMNDIVGAAPVPVWVSFVGKLAGVLLALLVVQLVLTIAGILLQVSLGYYNFQLSVYLKILLGLRLVDYVLFAVLAFAMHVLLNQKYLAHLICVLFYLLTMFGPEFGIESGLLMYGSDPGWSYSDLRGLDPFMKPWLIFKLYWGSWAMLLSVITIALWPRGTEKNILNRLKQAVTENTFNTKAVSGISLSLILITGGFIFYNTHTLHPKTTSVKPLEWKADYEKMYSKYRSNPGPILTKTNLQVEIYTEKRAVDFRGTYSMVNPTGRAIDTVFVTTAPGVENHQISFDRTANPVIDEELGFRIYVLEKPLAAGDSLKMDFHVTYAAQGFPNSGVNTSLAKNGTYFDDTWLPSIGYQKGREIYNSDDRKANGLPQKAISGPDVEASGQDRIDFEATVGTDEGLIATAPGKLIKSWTENDRSYFKYAAEYPIKNKLGFFSSNYKIHEDQWKSDSAQSVDIKILYHPEHTLNNSRMTDGVKASLSFMSREFGNYPHGELRFTEVPGYTKGLFAYPTNVFYREGFAHLKPSEDPRGIDVVFATVAHEVCHQWWGAQVMPSPVKGAALITESLAWYSAFEIIEEAKGRKEFLELVDLARDHYVSPQQREADPLLEASQTVIIYRKGPLALYSLREYIGKEQLRSRLRNFYNKYSTASGSWPLPSDLYEELRAVTPDSMRYLLHDLFATNTFWELKTERATALETETGKWKVKMDVKARKFTVDKKGNETDVPMNDWIHIGAYGRPLEDNADESSLYLKQHKIHSGMQSIEIVVTSKPYQAGIDPNRLLMDLKGWDNVTEVRLRQKDE